MAKRQCTSIITGNGCPLRALTTCDLGHNRVRVAQHIPGDSIKTEWSPSRKETEDTVSLLEIPREIRDAIFDCVLPSGARRHLDYLFLDTDTGLSHWHPRPSTNKPTASTSILCVSQQVHHEAAARLYGASDFVVLGFLRQGALVNLETLLSTFTFNRLLPLHPAYTRFVTRFDLILPNDNQWPGQGTLNITNPNPIRTATGGDLFSEPLVRTQDSAMATPEEIRFFITTAQASLDVCASCACVQIRPLDNGIYTLCRPPSPEREACKAKMWRGVEQHHGHTIEEMRQGRFRRERRRHKGFDQVRVCLAVLCLVCVGCPFAIPIWMYKEMKERWQSWRSRRRAKPGRTGILG